MTETNKNAHASSQRPSTEEIGRGSTYLPNEEVGPGPADHFSSWVKENPALVQLFHARPDDAKKQLMSLLGSNSNFPPNRSRQNTPEENDRNEQQHLQQQQQQDQEQQEEEEEEERVIQGSNRGYTHDPNKPRPQFVASRGSGTSGIVAGAAAAMSPSPMASTSTSLPSSSASTTRDRYGNSYTTSKGNRPTHSRLGSGAMVTTSTGTGLLDRQETLVALRHADMSTEYGYGSGSAAAIPSAYDAMPSGPNSIGVRGRHLPLIGTGASTAGVGLPSTSTSTSVTVNQQGDRAHNYNRVSIGQEPQSLGHIARNGANQPIATPVAAAAAYRSSQKQLNNNNSSYGDRRHQSGTGTGNRGSASNTQWGDDDDELQDSDRDDHDHRPNAASGSDSESDPDHEPDHPDEGYENEDIDDANRDGHRSGPGDEDENDYYDGEESDRDDAAGPGNPNRQERFGIHGRGSNASVNMNHVRSTVSHASASARHVPAAGGAGSTGLGQTPMASSSRLRSVTPLAVAAAAAAAGNVRHAITTSQSVNDTTTARIHHKLNGSAPGGDINLHVNYNVAPTNHQQLFTPERVPRRKIQNHQHRQDDPNQNDYDRYGDVNGYRNGSGRDIDRPPIAPHSGGSDSSLMNSASLRDRESGTPGRHPNIRVASNSNSNRTSARYGNVNGCGTVTGTFDYDSQSQFGSGGSKQSQSSTSAYRRRSDNHRLIEIDDSPNSHSDTNNGNGHMRGIGLTPHKVNAMKRIINPIFSEFLQPDDNKEDQDRPLHPLAVDASSTRTSRNSLTAIKANEQARSKMCLGSWMFYKTNANGNMEYLTFSNKFNQDIANLCTRDAVRTLRDYVPDLCQLVMDPKNTGTLNHRALETFVRNQIHQQFKAHAKRITRSHKNPADLLPAKLDARITERKRAQAKRRVSGLKFAVGRKLYGFTSDNFELYTYLAKPEFVSSDEDTGDAAYACVKMPWRTEEATRKIRDMEAAFEELMNLPKYAGRARQRPRMPWGSSMAADGIQSEAAAAAALRAVKETSAKRTVSKIDFFLGLLDSQYSEEVALWVDDVEFQRIVNQVEGQEEWTPWERRRTRAALLSRLSSTTLKRAAANRSNGTCLSPGHDSDVELMSPGPASASASYSRPAADRHPDRDHDLNDDQPGYGSSNRTSKQTTRARPGQSSSLNAHNIDDNDESESDAPDFMLHTRPTPASKSAAAGSTAPGPVPRSSRAPSNVNGTGVMQRLGSGGDGDRTRQSALTRGSRPGEGEGEGNAAAALSTLVPAATDATSRSISRSISISRSGPAAKRSEPQLDPPTFGPVSIVASRPPARLPNQTLLPFKSQPGGETHKNRTPSRLTSTVTPGVDRHGTGVRESRQRLSPLPDDSGSDVEVIDSDRTDRHGDQVLGRLGTGADPGPGAAAVGLRYGSTNTSRRATRPRDTSTVIDRDRDVDEPSDRDIDRPRPARGTLRDTVKGAAAAAHVQASTPNRTPTPSGNAHAYDNGRPTASTSRTNSNAPRLGTTITVPTAASSAQPACTVTGNVNGNAGGDRDAGDRGRPRSSQNINGMMSGSVLSESTGAVALRIPSDSDCQSDGHSRLPMASNINRISNPIATTRGGGRAHGDPGTGTGPVLNESDSLGPGLTQDRSHSPPTRGSRTVNVKVTSTPSGLAAAGETESRTTTPAAEPSESESVRVPESRSTEIAARSTDRQQDTSRGKSKVKHTVTRGNETNGVQDPLQTGQT